MKTKTNIAVEDPTEESDICNVICPYCKHEYQAESEDFDETEREEECESCERIYLVYQSFFVMHHTRPVPRPNET